MTFHSTPNVYVNQVHLKVTDLVRSLTFYEEIIGLKVLSQTEKSAVLTADGKNPLVTIEDPDGVIPKEPRRTGLYHFALLLPNREDLAACLKHLVESGYPLQGASDHLVSEAIYLGDPDGNGIEIYADRTSEQWQWMNDSIEMDTVALDVQDLFSQWKGDVWQGLPAGTIMGHIHLHVADLREAERFYCEGLGFDIVTRYGGQALFISTGRYHHHIGLNTWNGLGAPAPSKSSAGLEHYTLLFPSDEERQKAVERLQKMNANIIVAQDRIQVKDPSGTQIILAVKKESVI
ncbi:VOC family protein [Robertmurraya yapensis]|uniref:VOC family protein n=1 Tax=Bacillus yapensis TaxID=2492960 RepID=A0A431VYV9_9BACI|nr:VOC family protein [Bacillus yapensis]RTR28457.1 VOC family protein [Bacillus yapensis]TKS94518.1 VOC family protein [Bacillus yapensis]